MEQPTGEFRQDVLRTRTGEVVTGELLLTVGTADGSEARRRPDDWQPDARRIRPRNHSTGRALAPSPADVPLLDREADIAELLGLLAQRRSIRLVGQAGSGRSALLAAVAEAAGDLAPDGVVRLSGHRRNGADLLQDLFAATHHAPGFRPDRTRLTELLRPVAAIVVLDDVEQSGEDLEELLAAAPECAFLLTVPPGSPQLPLGSRMTDHLVAGLAKPACLALVARLAGRELDGIERAWAVDLWFESEGLPLRFVQAAALLRQRDVSVDALVAAQEDRSQVFGSAAGAEEPADPALLEAELRRSVPLPSVAETAAPAARLAAGLSDSAERVLRLAVALGGECPTAPHLPALIDVGLGESALKELVDAGLAISVGGHHRLTTGVVDLLAPHWDPGGIANGAAEHFSWWVGQSSVGVGQIAAEAEVIIGALLADRTAERPEAVLQLARAAAPALALSLRWGAWERALQLGLEAARRLGSAVDEAWFHHELGTMAFAIGARPRATAELEAAVALRAAVSELRGNAGARRMLDLLRVDALELPSGEGELPPVGRRPVIRAIAQAPFRFRPTHPGDTRRVVLAASAAVLAVGVLGTAIGLSIAGPGSADGRVPPGSSVDDPSVPANISFSPVLGDSASATDSASTSPSDSPSASDGSPQESRKPTSTKSPTTTAPTTPATTPPQPTTPGPTSTSTRPPTPTDTSTAPTTPPPTTTTSASSTSTSTVKP